MYENLHACRELSEMSPESPTNTQQLDTDEQITEQEESQYDREQHCQHAYQTGIQYLAVIIFDLETPCPIQPLQYTNLFLKENELEGCPGS